MLKRFRARNFKSLRSVELDVGGLTIFVGPNMGGKSNVLEALRFLYECWFPQPGQYGPVNALARRGGINEVLWKGGNDALLSLEVEVASATPDKFFEYKIELVGGANGYVNIQSEQLFLIQSGKRHPLITRKDEGRWLVNANEDTLVLIEAERSAMELAPANWDGYPLKWFAQNWRVYQLVPAVMKLANQITSGGVLEVQGQNLSAWLMWLQTRSPASFARIAEVTRDVFPEIQQLLTWPTQQGLVHLASQEGALLRPTPAHQMSDGELTFIAFLSLICAPDDLSGTLFLIEEPENHLHHRLIETLFRLLRQVRNEVQTRNVPTAQIMLTTHSSYIVDQATLDEIVWVERTAGETKLSRPGDTAELRRLVEDRVLGLGDLLFSGALSGH
jgi:predicted ATPase